MRTGALILLVILASPIVIGLSSPAPEEHVLPVAVPKYYFLETLTIYHPEESQCDNTPLITANNSRIDLEKLRRSEIRWMALSRDMLKRWNGDFNYGDTVMLYAGDESIDGLWVINDNMNKRFRNRGDLLFHRDARAGGIWKNVRINRWDKSMAAG